MDFAGFSGIDPDKIPGKGVRIGLISSQGLHTCFPVYYVLSPLPTVLPDTGHADKFPVPGPMFGNHLTATGTLNGCEDPARMFDCC